MGSDTSKKKAFFISGHAQSGKTSLSESILHKTGTINELGKVDQGNTVSDYHEDEKKRKSSINLSVLYASFGDNEFQFIDTPGYTDFIGEVVGAARASDFAIIVIDAQEGVGIGTEKAWQIVERENIPCLFFVNKLDKENTDYNQILEDIKKSLTKKIISLGFPEGKEIKSVLANKDKYSGLYSGILDSVAETDDALLEKYLEKGKLSQEELTPALKKAILESKVFPVTAGAALDETGVDFLMKLITEVMPSVDEAKKRKAKKDEEKEIEVNPSSDEPFSAQVFKTIIDPFVGQLSIFRVFSGKLDANQSFYNANKENKEKGGQIYQLEGKEEKSLDCVVAGDIGAIAKLKETKTGDTICDNSRMIRFKPLEFPEPSYSSSVKPKTRKDEDKISTALNRLTSEDPTCRVSRDPQTKELILSGMGELHLKLTIERMKEHYGADVDLGTPKVPYLETIAKPATVSYRYKKQTGGKGQFGEVSITVEPLERGKKFEFVNKIVGGKIPRGYIPSVEKGIENTMKKGFLAGYPITDIKVTLFDGSYHPVDSSDMAFQIAGSMALKNAFTEGGSVLLEPIMNVEIIVPSDLTGQITGDINSKRGRVLGMEPKGKNEVVKAQVPLAEMFKYASDLRSLTGGRGSYSMNFSNYEVVPARVAQDIVAKSKQEKEKVG
ncbi:MAG: elongation factor G [Candidatus Omnitrophica bacterium]|nr:elongation factor G [Candidatus Omnitrophota bacterium]MCF7878164.1 elongation factor G [Candidatus Omnitrophota bacterium]MCF7892616.1 elongation factor G [Candidatus Omnitrophota bacterium]